MCGLLRQRDFSMCRKRYNRSSVAIFLLGVSIVGSSIVTGAQAQYRASVGCSDAKIDSMSAEASLDDLKCKCFDVCPDPRSPPPQKPVDNRKFKFHEGRDIDGNDFRTLREVNLKECVDNCQGDGRCTSFSFDKWNRYCFLKQTNPMVLRVEPNSIVAVAATASPVQSRAPIVMERFYNRIFRDQPYREVRNTSYEECESHCRGDDRCEVYAHAKAERTCKLITRPGEWWRDTSADSGVKRQKP
jgi:hypothetical protein